MKMQSFILLFKSYVVTLKIFVFFEEAVNVTNRMSQKLA